MSIPRVRVNFRDGGLGIIPPGPSGAQAKVGVSLSGTVNTIYPCGSDAATEAALSGGPLAEATAAITGVVGTVVYAVPCPIVSAGSVGAWTHTGSGAGVVSSTVGPHVEILVKCSTGGTLSTAAFQFSVNGGAYGAPVISTASSFVYRVPGTFVTLTFGADTYRQNDVYTIPTSGTVSASSPSGGPNTITQASSPVDAYSVLVEVTLAGNRGTAQFRYSLDGGSVVSPDIVTAATYVIPGTGIILAFTNAAYVLGDTYAATATPPATDNTAIAAAIDVLNASQYVFEGIHVVGTPSSAANAATLSTAVDAKMTTAEANQRYEFSVIECPQSESDSTISTAFVSFASPHGRIFECCGDEDLVSTLSGLTLRRNGAWSLCARMAGSKLSENPGKVQLGSLPNVSDIYRNEEQTPGLCDARFVTLRTMRGKQGYFITDGPTMAQTTSDYSTIMNVRVANRVATIAAAAFTDYLNADVRVNEETGYIDERDALAIDTNVTSRLRSALQGTPGSSTDEVSSVTATMSRTDNLLANPVASAVVSIVPKEYLRSIDVAIGFRNPLVG
jgi:hypothetical protein